MRCSFRASLSWSLAFRLSEQKKSNRALSRERRANEQIPMAATFAREMPKSPLLFTLHYIDRRRFASAKAGQSGSKPDSSPTLSRGDKRKFGPAPAPTLRGRITISTSRSRLARKSITRSTEKAVEAVSSCSAEVSAEKSRAVWAALTWAQVAGFCSVLARSRIFA